MQIGGSSGSAESKLKSTYGGLMRMAKSLGRVRTRLDIAVIAGFICIGWSSACLTETTSSPPDGLLSRVDWQDPWLLPREFRNHCFCDSHGRYYCSNHCGADYAFYYCSRTSFGCCHVGKGYCDRDGLLRCRPALFP